MNIGGLRVATRRARYEPARLAAEQNSDYYLASENVKRETSPQEAEGARGY